MISARVAGVPRPLSFIASESSLSSSVRPAVSMAVRSVASVKRFGGRVFLATALASATRRASPRTSPGGRSWLSSPSPSSLSLLSLSSLPSFFSFWRSSTFHPGCSTAVPELWKRSTTDPRSEVTDVITVVTFQMWSSCQAMRRRRQIRS
jgi:hypothetical protein